MKLLYSIKESCGELAISRARLYELIGSGQISICKLGARTMVRGEELTRFAASLPDCGSGKEDSHGG
ncbi:MAG: helix-turn-helix domain-containing protein [Notoacmeibacter sp.]